MMPLEFCGKRILTITAWFSVLLYAALVLGFILPFWSSVDVFGSNRNVTLNKSIVTNRSYQNESSSKTEITVGLFTLCHKLEDYYCCGNWQYMDTAFKNADWITTISTLLVIALLSGLVPMLPCYCRSRWTLSYAFINFITSILVLVSCALFMVNNMDISGEHEVKFSFLITTFSGTGYLIMTLVHIAMYKNPSKTKYRVNSSSEDNDYVNPSSCTYLFNACSSGSDGHSQWTVVFHCTVFSAFLMQEVNFLLPLWTLNNKIGVDVFEGVLVKCYRRETATCCGFNNDAFSPHSEMSLVFPLLLGLQIASIVTGITAIILFKRWLYKDKPTALRTFVAVLLSVVNCAVLVAFSAVYRETIHNPDKSETAKFGPAFYFSILLVIYHLVVAIIIAIASYGKQCRDKCHSLRDAMTTTRIRGGVSQNSSDASCDTEAIGMSQRDSRLGQSVEMSQIHSEFGHTNQGFDAHNTIEQIEQITQGPGNSVDDQIDDDPINVIRTFFTQNGQGNRHLNLLR